jgi:hypothetical protein
MNFLFYCSLIFFPVEFSLFILLNLIGSSSQNMVYGAYL